MPDDDKVAYYLRQAAKLAELASRAGDADIREALLNGARQYQKLAEEARRR
jgi:hypothetical protein